MRPHQGPELAAERIVTNCIVATRSTDNLTTAATRDLKGLLIFIWGFMNHFWMWDFKSIVPELEAAGFRDIRRVQFNYSADPIA